MGPALTFQLPLPDKALSPNARGHWSGKSKVTKSARAAARLEALRVLGDAGLPAPRWAQAKWKAVYFLGPCDRQRDPDNAVAILKAYIDGLADARIVINDRGLWPERPEFRRVDRMARVEITVEPE